MSPTAVVHLTGQRLELVRHPRDGHVIAFESADDAFAFALSLEIAGAPSAGTVDVPANEAIHMVAPGVTAFDLNVGMERGA
jgi:hypothetical protein